MKLVLALLVVGALATIVCEDTCTGPVGSPLYIGDGDCDDGARNSDFYVCDFGTDCTDCGPRSTASDAPLCTDSCAETSLLSNGKCNDGGPSSFSSECPLGTDCFDCGERESSLFDAPSASPTAAPSNSPSVDPTPSPSDSPTPAPTDAPSDSPTPAPTHAPSESPTVSCASDCPDGEFLRGCVCVKCPTGTFRKQSTTPSQYCEACGGPQWYCPGENLDSPTPRNPGECTVWWPYSSVDSKSERYDEDVDYFDSKFDSPEDRLWINNAETTINTLFDRDRLMRSKAWGLMREVRTHSVPCGTLELSESVFNLTIIPPSLSFSPVFEFTNQWQVPVNFTLTNAPSYVELFKTSNLASPIEFDAVFPGDSSYVFSINGASIPSAVEVFEVEFSIRPYWVQKAFGEVEEIDVLKMKIFPEFGQSALLVRPDGFKISMPVDTIESFTAIITNFRSFDVEFNVTSSSEMVSTDFTDQAAVLPAGAVCEVVESSCQPEERDVSAFSKEVLISIDSRGLSEGVYFPKVSFESDVSSVDVNLQITVTGGAFVSNKTSVELSPKPNDGRAYEMSVEAPQLLLTPRDTYSNVAIYDSVVFFRVEWQLVTGNCLPDLVCAGSASSTTVDVTNVARLDLSFFPQQGEYHLFSYAMPLNELVSDSPTIVSVGPRKCFAEDEEGFATARGDQCACSPGFGQDEDKLPEFDCVPCPAGSFSSNQTNFRCQSCAAGFVSTSQASIECVRCPDYLSEPNLDGSECVPCLESLRVPLNSNAWECLPCDDPATQRIRHLRNRVDLSLEFVDSPLNVTDLKVPKMGCACKATYYLNSVTNKCEPCPAGAHCVDRTSETVIPRYGYWGPVPSSESENGVPLFLECRREDACPGIKLPLDQLLDDAAVAAAVAEFKQTLAQQSTCNPCKEEFTGPLCFQCNVGFTRVGQSDCVKCLNRALVLSLVVLGGLVAILVTVYIIRRTLQNLENDTNEIIVLKILTSHMQAEGTIQNFDLEWPTWLNTLYEVFIVISSGGQSVFTLDCLVEIEDVSQEQCGDADAALDMMSVALHDENRLRSFFFTSLFVASLPVLGLVASAAFWYLRWKYFKSYHNKSHAKSFFRYFLVSNVIVVFLLYPTLSRASLRFFSCSRERVAGSRYVEADFNIECGGAEHKLWSSTLGLMMILAYAVGIPAFTLTVLVKAKDSKYYNVFSFIFRGFRAKYFYWETVIMLRKLALAFCAVILKPFGSDVQAQVALLVVVLCIFATIAVRPYEEFDMNFAETFGLTTLFLTLYLGLLQSSPSLDLATTETNESVHFGIAVTIVVLNAIFILYLLGVLTKTMRQEVKKLPDYARKNLPRLASAVSGRFSRSESGRFLRTASGRFTPSGSIDSEYDAKTGSFWSGRKSRSGSKNSSGALDDDVDKKAYERRQRKSKEYDSDVLAAAGRTVSFDSSLSSTSNPSFADPAPAAAEPAAAAPKKPSSPAKSAGGIVRRASNAAQQFFGAFRKKTINLVGSTYEVELPDDENDDAEKPNPRIKSMGPPLRRKRKK